jgi:hypothetical protein
VTDWPSHQDVDEVLSRGQALRRRLGLIAASIAQTEDRLADTLEQVALSRPGEASRLRAHAASARRFAAAERERAADYRPADGGQDPTDKSAGERP